MKKAYLIIPSKVVIGSNNVIGSKPFIVHNPLVNPFVSSQHHYYNIVCGNGSKMQRRVAILVLLVHQASKAPQL